ncbi:MAG: phage tail tube protein [Sphingomonas sp.]
MTTEVETGHGSQFWLDDAGGTPVQLAEVLSVPIPSGAAELIKASHMGTTGFHDYITAPLREGEEAEVTMNFLPGSPTDQLCVAAVGATRDFRAVIPTGAGTYEYSGSVIVRDYKRGNDMEDRRQAALVIKWVSAITEGAGA